MSIGYHQLRRFALGLARAAYRFAAGDFRSRAGFSSASDERHKLESAVGEEQYRMALEAGRVGTFDWDIDADVVRWDERTHNALGLAPGEALDFSHALNLADPDDQVSIMAAVARALDPAVAAPFVHEWRIRGPDGMPCWMETQGRALFTGEGRNRRAYRLLGTVRGITRRKHAELALRESERRFRATFENAAVGITQVAPDGSFLRVNDRLCGILGFSAEELTTKTFQDITHPEDLDADLALLNRMLSGEIDQYDMEKRYVRQDLSIICCNLTVGCVRKDDGAVDYLIAVVEDITERKEAEAHSRLLLREVNHRAKNLLAVIQAVARQTAGEDDPKVFAQRFAARLAGLAASQDLLVKSDWRGVNIGELVCSQLAHFVGLIETRILPAGPALRLSPAATQTIGMALHELATNAGKYGALSNAEGTVELRWELTANSGSPHFQMRWIERGGPPVSEPRRNGFGHTVMVRMVEHALDAEVCLEHQSGGTVWRMRAPADTVLDAAKEYFSASDGAGAS